MNVIIRNNHFLHVTVNDGNGEVWFLTMVYASPRESERNITWMELEDVSKSTNGRWLMVRDFNEIAAASEKKKGGVDVDHHRCHAFAQWINKCKLMEVDNVGTRFT